MGQKIFRDFQDDERYISFLREYKAVLVFAVCLHVNAFLYLLFTRNERDNLKESLLISF